MDAPTSGIEPSPQDLAVRVACEQLLYVFALNIDSGAATNNVDLFSDDARLAFGEHALTGREQIRAAMVAREADVARMTRHQISNIIFERTGVATARVRSLLVLYVLGGPDELAVRAITAFDDEFARDSGGRWRFSARNARILAGTR